MPRTHDAIRDHLIRVLDWEEAHVGFDKAVTGVPIDARGMRPAGFAQSIWQLVEHLRIAQDDLLDFCANPHYVHTRAWPDDYWPKEPAPPSDQAWSASIAAYVQSRDALKTLVQQTDDLAALVPTGTDKQTYLRAVLLVADHAAYHVGQIVAVRKALGLWG